MNALYQKIAALTYEVGAGQIFWHDILLAHFNPRNIDDLTDFDNEASLEETYLISLNPHNEKLLSEEIDQLLGEEDAYFACIQISNIKPLAFLQYWKYPKEDRGQKLLVSNRPFLPEQGEVGRKFRSLADAHKLLILTEEEYEIVRGLYFYEDD